MNQNMSHGRGRLLLAFWLRTAIFLVLLAAAMFYTLYVLSPKYDYGMCSMDNLYRQPDNSVDVLVVGTSVAYAGVNTNVLYEEYGIAAYDLCSAEQPFWISYYALREALKTQTPKLILLDTKPALYDRDYTSSGRIIMSTYGIRSLENRIGAIRACVASDAEALEYLLMFPVLHSKYDSVTAEDFIYPLTNGGRGQDWKGYIEEDAVEFHRKPTFTWNSVRQNLNAREEEYARKIFALAQEENIPMMLITLPNPDYASEHMYVNALYSIAAEYGITGINYNDPDLHYGLRYSTDFADWQHLNVKGSMTLSRQLGADLRALFDLPDRRGNAAYESYQRCADEWYAIYPGFESSGVKEVEP